MSGIINILNHAVSLDSSPAFAPFTGVRLWYDDEQAFFSGDETGRVLEANCPWATQAIADSVLASILGYVYQPFEAGSAMLDPAAELGDGVTVGGVYGPLASINTVFDAACAAEISAPEDEEINHEYPYLSSAEREYKRNKAQTYSLISKTADEIRLEVHAIQEDMENYSTIEQTAASIEAAVSGKIDGEEADSLIRQAIDGISLSVNNKGTSSTIGLLSDGVEISSQNITFNGFVTFNGLADGSTTIDGGCIKTGTIDVDRINMTGAITWGDLDSSVQSTINSAGGISASQARTIITQELVSSPNIAGARFLDLDQSTWLEMDTPNSNVAYLHQYANIYSNSEPVCAMGYYTNGTSKEWVLAPFNTITMGYSKTGQFTYCMGDWDFSQADTTGLYLRFS